MNFFVCLFGIWVMNANKAWASNDMGIFKFLLNWMFYPRFLEHCECRIFQLAPYRFISMIQFWGRLWPKIPISIIWTHQIKKDRETFKPLINNGESAATGLSKKRKKVHKRNPYLWTELSLVRAQEKRRGGGMVWLGCCWLKQQQQYWTRL